MGACTYMYMHPWVIHVSSRIPAVSWFDRVPILLDPVIHAFKSASMSLTVLSVPVPVLLLELTRAQYCNKKKRFILLNNYASSD